MLDGASNTFDLSDAVIASSPDAIVAADLRGRIIAWNPAAEQLMGRSAEEAIGTDLESVMPPGQRPDARALIERARAGETVTREPVDRLHADGSVVTGTLILAPIRNVEGAIVGTVGIMRDTRAQRRLRDFARRNQRLASVGTLAAGIAHEINNPVGGILMASQYAATALGRADGKTIVSQALADIAEDAKRCREIVRKLVRLARADSEARSEVDLVAVVASAIDLTGADPGNSAASVSLDAADDLPPIEISAADIRQALVNLLLNAGQSGASQVSVGVHRNDDALEVTVEDNGGGVAEEALDYLFDPFFTTGRSDGFRGLGLSVAHAIVTNHGGALDVASSEGSGTTVTMILPLSTPSA